MKPSWTIGRRLTVACGVVALLLVTASVTGLVDSYRARASQDRLLTIAASSRAAAEVETLTRSMDANQKLILVAGLTGVVERSESGIKGIAKAAADIATRLDGLAAAATTGKAKQDVKELADRVEVWKRHHADVIALVTKQDFDNALTIDLGDSFAAQTKILEQAEVVQTSLTTEAEAARTSAQQTTTPPPGSTRRRPAGNSCGVRAPLCQGEAGMGFAVVADEVRNLAQRSAQAAKDTAALIEASANNARSGGAKVDAVVTAMAAITTSSAQMHSLIEEVSVASRQQTQGIDQVTQAIAQMEKVTQTTAATAEESAASSQELNSQAEQSMAVVQRLEGMVHGGQAGGHEAPAPRVARVAPRVEPKTLTLIHRGAPSTRLTAEEQIPFDETGTFGRF